ncbi:MAG TPA: OmpA family protein [Burkholderiales bacterium]|nr:OmpA family protein [Burkholderiales bacterium]
MLDQRDVTVLRLVAAGDRRGRFAFIRFASALVFVTLLAACAQQTPPPNPIAKPEPVPEVESVPPKPEATQPVPAPGPRVTRNDQVIVLPKADGSVGAVVVRQNGIEIVLDKPYASAVIEGPGQVRELTSDAGFVKENFATALAALPAKPASFLLYFLKGKDELTPASKREVKRILAELAKRPAAEISVIGHTDTFASAKFNDKLSLQRARRVRQLLIARGIPAGSISAAGRGKRELLVPTPDKVHEPKNRRVEINVR